jgi:hypothetical protein
MAPICDKSWLGLTWWRINGNRHGSGMGGEADFSTARRTMKLSVASVEMTSFGRGWGGMVA